MEANRIYDQIYQECKFNVSRNQFGPFKKAKTETNDGRTENNGSQLILPTEYRKELNNKKNQNQI